MPTKQTTIRWGLAGLCLGISLMALIIYQDGFRYIDDLLIGMILPIVCGAAAVPWLWFWAKSLVLFIIRETSDATLHRRLLKVKQLHDAGVLTEAEYQTKLDKIKNT